MRVGLEGLGRDRLALVEPRQARVVVVGGRGLVVLVTRRLARLLVGGEEAGERDDGAGRGELDRVARARAPTRTVEVVPLASFIWLATVRFQMSS